MSDKRPCAQECFADYLAAQGEMLTLFLTFFPTSADPDTASAIDLKCYALMAEIQRLVFDQIVIDERADDIRTLIAMALEQGNCMSKAYIAATAREN